MDQMRRYGIPASVTLAQGIIESADGKSTLSKTANNHFGVKGEFNGHMFVPMMTNQTRSSRSMIM